MVHSIERPRLAVPVIVLDDPVVFVGRGHEVQHELNGVEDEDAENGEELKDEPDDEKKVDVQEDAVPQEDSQHELVQLKDEGFGHELLVGEVQESERQQGGQDEGCGREQRAHSRDQEDAMPQG